MSGGDLTDTGSEPKSLGILDQTLTAFKNRSLLDQALTRRSLAQERKESLRDNERLEWLGDRVLGLAVSSYLYDNKKKATEAELDKPFQDLVDKENLAKVSRKLGLAKLIPLSGAERGTLERSESKILADTFEAILGAIYLDQGYHAARDFIEKTLFETK